jgi:hypothetical protein
VPARSVNSPCPVRTKPLGRGARIGAAAHANSLRRRRRTTSKQRRVTSAGPLMGPPVCTMLVRGVPLWPTAIEKTCSRIEYCTPSSASCVAHLFARPRWLGNIFALGPNTPPSSARWYRRGDAKILRRPNGSFKMQIGGGGPTGARSLTGRPAGPSGTRLAASGSCCRP